MTTVPTQQPRHQLFPWGLSFCIHATVVAGAVTLLHDLPRVEPPVYRMEFLLTDPQSEAEAAPPQETAATEDSSLIMPSSSPATSPSTAEMIENQPISEPSITQQTLNQAAVADEAPHETRLSPTSSISPPVAHPAPIDRRIETADRANNSNGPVTTHTAQAVKHPIMTEPAQVTAASVVESMAKNLQDDTSPDSTISPPASYADSAPSSLSAEQTSVTASSTGSQASETAPASSEMHLESQSDASQQSVGMNRPTMTRTVPSKSQYGWLAELLRRRTMSLLAYPRLARMQGWEGVVVVKTTIDSDGGLVDAVVTKSSGYELLDEDALKLMHRVCPIRLPQDLGRSHISMSIPIRYRIEQ
jgi:protein TonB